MGDERDQDAQRTPLWPPDPAPAQESPTAAPYRDGNERAPWEAPQPAPYEPYTPSYAPYAPPAPPEPAESAVSESPTMRVNAAPASPFAAPTAPPEHIISDAQTMRVNVAPPAPAAPVSPGGAGDEPLLTAEPVQAAQAGHLATPFAPAPRLAAAPEATPPTTAPEMPPAQRKGLSLAWRLGLTLLICLILLAGAAGLYAYASSLAAQPQRLMTSYCSALTHDDYRAAYNLLSSAAQAQEDEARYLSDASARNTISGRITTCATTPTQVLSPLSFLRSPRSLIFNATITRKQAATGQIALTRDATGWHVAALSSSLQGVDLGPLYTEQALCAAFSQRAYTQAYALLSTPYQKEQGDAATFARDFGATLTLAGCSPNLTSYSVNPADQKATLDATLSVNVASSSGGSPSSFSVPARISFVREATGWRVDAITPQLVQ